MSVRAYQAAKRTTMLSGKTALVAEASRGIGRASALAPAAAGAQVLVPAAPFSGEDRGKSA